LPLNKEEKKPEDPNDGMMIRPVMHNHNQNDARSRSPSPKDHSLKQDWEVIPAKKVSDSWT